MKMFNKLRVALSIAATFAAVLLLAVCQTTRRGGWAFNDGDTIRTVPSVVIVKSVPSGTVRDDPKEIANEADLRDFAATVLTAPDTDGVLTADIPLAQPWTPIGKDNSKSPPEITAYLGTFDGGGFTISGLNVTETTSYAGLFALNEGTIQDLTVAGSVTANQGALDIDYVAGVVAYNGIAGTVQNVASQVTVTAAADTTHNIGGIAGFNGWDHYNPDSPYKDDPDDYEPGGVILQCRNDGAVSGGFNKIGGIVGENAYQITECVNTGTITCAKTGRGWPGVGGIAGRNGNNNTATEQGAILNCYNRGTVKDDTTQSSSNNAYGGITGWCNTLSTVTNCYSTGDLTPTVGTKNPIIGTADSTAGIGSNNYSLDTVFASSKDVILTGVRKDSAYMKSAAFVSDLNGSSGPYVPVNNDYPKLAWE